MALRESLQSRQSSLEGILSIGKKGMSGVKAYGFFDILNNLGNNHYQIPQFLHYYKFVFLIFCEELKSKKGHQWHPDNTYFT